MANFKEEVKVLYPFLPDGLVDLFVEKYIDFDKNINLALNAVRADANYDNYFPGNKRADGSVRLSEAEYGSVVDSYKDDLRKFE
jgi:hypothetical protein